MTDLGGASSTKVNKKVNSHGWCVTDRKTIQFGYTWSVRKFSQLQLAQGECIESPPFSASENDKNKWSLVLYPKGYKKENTSYVSLYLKFLRPLQVGKSIELNAKFQLSFLDQNIETMRMKEADKIHTFTNEERWWGFGHFIKRDDLKKANNELIFNDTVVFCCNIAILAKPKHTDGRYTCGTDLAKNRLANDLGRMLNDQHSSDVVLVAEDKELHAHKVFLCARSPVFAAMFEHDMTEKQQNRVVITDIDYTVLEELVRFMYTGKTPIMNEELGTKLLAASDKYGLEDLKVMCEQALTLCLTSDNAAHLVRLAIFHNAKHLQTHILQFVKSRTKDLVLNKLFHDLITP